MKTKLCLAIVMGFILLVGYPQQETPIVKSKVRLNETNSDPSGAGGSSSTGLATVNNLGEECCMYMNESFQKGNLSLKDNTIIENRLYRYNMYSQQMEFTIDNDTAAIGNPDEIRVLQLENNNFVYAEYINSQNVSKGYMEILVEGDYRLLLYRDIKYTHRENASDPTAKPEEKYYLEKKYFISFKNEPANHVLLNRKDVINSVQVPEKTSKNT